VQSGQLKQSKVKIQQKNNRKKLDSYDEDALYFVSDKDAREVVEELGLSRFDPLFD
jgi:hypothetical protein